MHQKKLQSTLPGIWLQTPFQYGGVDSVGVLLICRKWFEPKYQPHCNHLTFSKRQL